MTNSLTEYVVRAHMDRLLFEPRFYTFSAWSVHPRATNCTVQTRECIVFNFPSAWENYST